MRHRSPKLDAVAHTEVGYLLAEFAAGVFGGVAPDDVNFGVGDGVEG